MLKQLLIICAICTISVDCIITRREWGARSTKLQTLRENPPRTVLIHHSAGPACNSESQCKRIVQQIQNDHIDNRHFNDIGYNFLIGGDGSVFEGRGWGKHGAHDPKYNARSIGICLLGNFVNSEPSEAQLSATKKLISDGVNSGEISRNYQLIGHRQSKPTECPGDKLFNIVKTWPHFAQNPTP